MSMQCLTSRRQTSQLENLCVRCFQAITTFSQLVLRDIRFLQELLLQLYFTVLFSLQVVAQTFYQGIRLVEAAFQVFFVQLHDLQLEFVIATHLTRETVLLRHKHHNTMSHMTFSLSHEMIVTF